MRGITHLVSWFQVQRDDGGAEGGLLQLVVVRCKPTHDRAKVDQGEHQECCHEGECIPEAWMCRIHQRGTGSVLCFVLARHGYFLDDNKRDSQFMPELPFCDILLTQYAEVYLYVYGIDKETLQQCVTKKGAPP